MIYYNNNNNSKTNNSSTNDGGNNKINNDKENLEDKTRSDNKNNPFRKSFDEAMNRFAKDANEIFEALKKETHKTIEYVEQKVESREGIIGDIANAAESIYVAATEKHDSIKARGGYEKVADEIITKAINNLETYATKANLKIASGVDKIVTGLEKELDFTVEEVKGNMNDLAFKLLDLEEKITTDGKMDYEKIKSFVKEKVNIEKYGKDTYNGIVKIVHEGRDKLKKTFREYVPTREEIDTKYKDIGVRSGGRIFFRPDYEVCIKYASESFGKIPGQLKLKGEILTDIRESGSGNSYELKQFYMEEFRSGRLSQDLFSRKYEAIMKYKL